MMPIQKVSTMKFITLLLVLSIAIAAKPFEPYKIRLTYTGHNANLDQGFIDRAKAANYNTIAVEFKPEEVTDFRDLVENAATLCLQNDMRFIPVIQSGSKWCRWWDDIRSSGYGDIQLNRTVDANGGTKVCTQMTPSNTAQGMDQAFSDLMNETAIGYAAALTNTGQSGGHLEYILLGHDEPVVDGNHIVGNPSNTLESSASDHDSLKKWIDENPSKPISFAYQKLFVSELNRRLEQVQTSFLGTFSLAPQVIIYADLWDPEANGGCTKSTPFGNVQMVDLEECKKGNYNQGIATLTNFGLSDAQYANIKKNVILAPWCYYKSWYSKTVDYNSNTMFNYFTYHGFKIIPISSLTEPIFDDYEKDMAYEYIYTAQQYRDNVIGFSAIGWRDWDKSKLSNNQDIEFDIMEFIDTITTFRHEPVHCRGNKTNKFLYVSPTEITIGNYEVITKYASKDVLNVPDGSIKPVTNITYYDAIKYCNERSKIEGLDTVYSYNGTLTSNGSNLSGFVVNANRNGYRLPTKEEFKHLYFAGINYTNEVYWNISAGEVAKDYAVFSPEKLSPVASKLPNGYGLYDIAGNVYEMVEKDEHNYSYATGGAYTQVESFLKCIDSNFFRISNTTKQSNIGFRVVRNYIDMAPINTLLLK